MTCIRDMPPGSVWRSPCSEGFVVDATMIVLALIDDMGIVWVSDVYDALGPMDGQRTLDILQAMGSLKILRRRVTYEAANLKLSAAGWA